MASSGWAEGRGAGAMALDAKLEELVKKMDAATGTAKIDAMAELLTVLVNDRRTMGGHMMANMTSMMDMMSMMSMKHNMGMTGMKEKMPEATQPKE